MPLLKGESMQALKKQFTNANKKPKPKASSPKDPQSIAAKVCLNPSQVNLILKQMFWVKIKQKQQINYVTDERMFVFQNRRERISERLKTLQELVPNGSKVMITETNYH